MKTLGSLFDRTAGRATTEEMQRGMRKYGTPAREAGESVARRLHTDTIKEIDDLVAQGWNESDLLKAVRMHAEGVVPGAALNVHPDLWAAAAPLGQRLGMLGKDWIKEAQRLGVPQQDLGDDFINYFFRQAKQTAGAGPQMRGGNLFPTTHGSNIRRKDIYSDIPGGTEMFNKWAADPNLAGPARAYTPDQVVQSVLADMNQQLTAQGITPTPEMLAGLERKAKQMGRRLAKSEPVPAFFDPNLVGALDLRARRQGTVESSAKGLYGTVGETARRMGPGMVPVTDLIGAMDKKVRLKTYAEPGRLEGALVELHKALARQGMGPTEPLIESIMAKVQAAPDPRAARKELMAGMRQLKREVGKYGVTRQQADNILKDYGKWTGPVELEAPLKGVDSFTNFFRNMAYSIWLPSHVRNLMGGLVQSATQPNAPGLRDYARMRQLMRDNSPAAQALKGEMFQHGKIFSGMNAAETAASNISGRITPRLPGSELPITPRELAGAAGQTAKGVANPRNWPSALAPGGVLEQAGVRGGEQNFPWLEAGRRLGTVVEDFLRGAQYLGQTRRGVSPAEAGREVLRTHFDYGGLTPFERKVMRRAVPFYTFASRNLPLQLDTLVHRPGAIVPQLRAVANRPGTQVPGYLASGVSVPLGGETPEGTQQFLSQLGIPIEEAFERFKIAPGDPLGSARNLFNAYAAGLNPLLKGPLEQVFNTQFFTGRSLSDLKPQGSVGGLLGLFDPDVHHPALAQLASQVVANTPATRFVTQLDKLTDPRKSWWQKGLNTLTGVRVSDVDMEKTRAIETRKVLEAILRGSPAISQHTEPYVRPEDQAKLTPDDVLNLQVLSVLQSRAQLAAKQRRLAASQQQP